MRRLVSLVILLFLPIVAYAQQPASSRVAASSSLLRSRDGAAEPAGTNPGATIYLVRSLAQKILALQDVKAKTMGAGRIADLIWTQDQPYARELFEKALSLTAASGANGDRKRQASLRRSVIALISRRDAEWAMRLIDAPSDSEASATDSKNRSLMNLSTALSLLEDGPDKAMPFAERCLEGGFSLGLLQFLTELRKTDEAGANQFFLRVLASLSQQPVADIKQLHLAGLYLFTAPNLFGSDGYIVTRVGDILVPNITIQRPGVPASLTRAYLETAASLLWRSISDSEQRQYSYALAYLLLAKSRSVAPDLAPRIEASMSALAPGVSPSLTEDSAYRYLDQPALSDEERLNNAENKPDQDSRDIAYLDLVTQSWLKKDFKMARAATNRIANQEANRRLTILIDFAEATSSLKLDHKRVSEAEAIAEKLPQGIERAILLLTISQTRAKAGESIRAGEAVDSALKASRSVNDARRPFLMLCAASQLAGIHSFATQSVLSDSIKEFNAFDDVSLAAIDWNQTVQVGPLVARFPLDKGEVDFSFERAFLAIVVADPEGAAARAENLKNEFLRARGFVAVAATLLKKGTERVPQDEQPIRVGEDGMRKSASKTVMPSYPADSLKKRQQGPAIVDAQYDGDGNVTSVSVLEAPCKPIGDAVVEAIRLWKFVPSKAAGKPVNIRGKLTFYFEIDKDGKGLVQNPKQFR